MADQGSECSDRQLTVLRDRKIYADSWFAHYNVASDLADHNPAGFLERFDRILAGNIGKPGHASKP